jgi:mannose-6-phosphate isomerase-like protein (cupin superfamily)
LAHRIAGVSYALKNLRESEDLAVKGGFSDSQEARFPYRDLEAEATGFGLITIKPGKRQPFAHRQKSAEEIYLVLSGDGKLRLDDEILDVGPMDAIRISPEHTRMLEAGPDGLEVLAFGPHSEDDAEIVPGFWEDD